MEQNKSIEGGKNMQFTKKRKIYILAGMFVLLAVTGYLNFTMNANTAQVGGELRTNQDFFVMFTQTRTAERNANKAILQSIAGSENGYTEEVRTAAGQQLLQLMNTIEFENVTESLILRHGFSNVIVTKTNNNINILVRNPVQLEEPEVANILQVIKTNFPGGAAALDVERVFLSVIA